MTKRKKDIALVVWVLLILVFVVLSLVIRAPHAHEEGVQALMKDAVLHEENQIGLAGLVVNP